MKIASFLLFAALVGLFLAGCTADKKGKQDTTSEVKGKVMALEPKKPAVSQDHADNPDWMMKAMEMEFPVENAKLLDGIKPGDQVRGKIKKTESGYLITELQKR